MRGDLCRAPFAAVQGGGWLTLLAVIAVMVTVIVWSVVAGSDEVRVTRAADAVSPGAAAPAPPTGEPDVAPPTSAWCARFETNATMSPPGDHIAIEPSGTRRFGVPRSRSRSRPRTS